jgi:hypothetical protein
MTDIGACFNPKNHPDVKYGRVTVATLLSDFFETFTSVTSNGYVTLDQFLEYYANAAFFEDDSDFDEIMSSVWKFDNAKVPSGPTKSLQDISRSRGQAATTGAPVTTRTIPPLEELKSQLAARGASGIIGLSRKFRIMDDDGSKSLNLSEFKKGIRECALDLTEMEMNQLFQHFDRDRSGTIDYDEFLLGVRVIN